MRSMENGRNLGVGVFKQRQASLRRGDFRDGRGKRARQHGA